MTRSVESLIFKTKALLCIALAAVSPLSIIGCGAAPAASMPMSDQNELAQKLMGTPFAGAKSIDVDSSNQSFRINASDPNSWMTGTFTPSGNGPAFVSSLTLVSAGQVATFNFNANKEITSIETSQGVWQRPADATSKASNAMRSQSEVDQYVAANAELLAQAKQADNLAAQQGSVAAPTDQSDKVGDQSLGPIALVLGGVIFVGAAVFATILFVIEVVVVINAIS